MNKLKEIVEKFDDDKIEEFLATIDMKEIIEESSKGINSPTDDGPPTFYRTFSDYKSKSKSWIKQLQTELGWEVINYILSKGAEDPELDFTMSYRAVPAISYGEKKKYKNHMRDVLDNLGWRIVKWFGVDSDQLLAGPPVAAGVSKAKKNILNTTLQSKSAPKFDGDKKRSKLNTEKYDPLTKKWWDDIVRKELLVEGGAYGHMAHPFDDKDLTFKDLKNIIDMGLGGELNREDNVTEKLDGQNLMISWRA